VRLSGTVGKEKDMGKHRKGKSLNDFEKILYAKREELYKRIEQQRAALSGEHDPDDEAALAVRSVERELAMANLDRDTRTLGEVEAGLRSIASGSYGICGRCQEAISDARLRALPWTRLCLECASGGAASGTARSGAGRREQSYAKLVSSESLPAARGRDRAK
jgi:DnaK suppressor protein